MGGDCTGVRFGCPGCFTGPFVVWISLIFFCSERNQEAGIRYYSFTVKWVGARRGGGEDLKQTLRPFSFVVTYSKHKFNLKNADYPPDCDGITFSNKHTKRFNPVALVTVDFE